MTKDELLLLVSAKLHNHPRVIEKLKKCDTVDEMIVTLPAAIGEEIVTLLKER